MKSSIRWILIYSFLASIIIFSGVFVYGYNQFEEVRNLSHDIVQSKTRKYELASIMHSSARERMLYVYSMINSDDPFFRDQQFLQFNKEGAIFSDAQASLIEQHLGEEELTILASLDKHKNTSAPILNKIVGLIQTDKIEQAKALLSHSGEQSQALMLDDLKQLLAIQVDDSHNILNEIDTQFKRSRTHTLTWAIFTFVVGALIALFVIIKLTKIEHRLFDEIEHSRATLASISDALLKTDTEGVIVFANNKAHELFGADVIGQPLLRYLPFISQDALNENTNNSNYLGLHTIPTDSGEIWVQAMLEFIHDEEGEESGKLIVLHNQTEVVESQKRLEALNEDLEKRVQERTRDLEKSNDRLKDSLLSLARANEQLVQSEKMAALGGLVAGISHEINTPIGIGVTTSTNIEESIISLEKLFTEGKLTRSEFENKISQTRQGLDILIKNLHRASDLIKSFKKVAVDQSSDELRDIDVREYCDEIILSLQPKIKATRVQVHNNVPSGIRIHTNPGAIYQVLSNLIMNSLIHAFDDETEDEEITLHASVENERLKLEYSDNGKGVDQETLKKIFEPFFTTRRGQGGSGLGMNVVYNLVTTSLKGQIDVQNNEDNGIKFEINMPVKLQVQAA